MQDSSSQQPFSPLASSGKGSWARICSGRAPAGKRRLVVSTKMRREQSTSLHVWVAASLGGGWNGRAEPQGVLEA